MFIFLAIASLIFGSAHYYVFLRISDYFNLSPDMRSVTSAVSMVLCILLVISMPIMRRLSKKVASLLAWVVFSWMGMLMLLVISFLASDIILLLMNFFSFFSRGIASEYIFIKNFLGHAAVFSAIFLTIFSIHKALREVIVNNVAVHINNLPEQLSGLRIVQLTDLHVGPTINGDKLLSIVQGVNRLNPDIVAITGDLVDGSVAELGKQIDHLKDLQSKYGVYFVTGNHEYYSGVTEWVKYLRKLGIKVLRNELVTIEHNGKKIEIAGVDDYHGGQDMRKAMANHNPTLPLILLAHQPASIDEAAKYNVDLQISGHTHGGQIWPWHYAVLLQQPYVSGLHRHKDTKTQIYISSGTGYWGPPMRFGTKAEITDICLLAA